MDSFMQNEMYEGYGSSPEGEVQKLLKSLQAQDGTITDVANLTSLGALQPQSLENTLALLTFQEKHLTLYRDMPKSQAFSTLEEYSSQSGYGHEGGWVGQMETPLEADPYAKRHTLNIKFLRQLWKMSDVAGLVRTITPAEMWQKEAATLRILRGLNSSLYVGDETLIPEQIPGFMRIIENNGSPDHVFDMRGGLPTQNTFRLAGELISSNFGTVGGAGLYCSQGGITSLNSILESGAGLGANGAQRFLQGTVGADGGLAIGNAVNQIHTGFGTIVPKLDIFISKEFESRGVPKRPNPTNPEVLVEGATSVRSPNAPTFALGITAPTVTGSLWSGTGVRPAATGYNYRVAAGNRFGLSAAAAVQTAAAVAAGGAITVTITPDPNSTFPATYFEIYSEQVAGSGNLFFVKRVAANGLTPVVFSDLNTDIPGTTRMFLLDLTSAGQSRTCSLKQLAPLHSKEYSRIGEYIWGSVNLYVGMAAYAPLRFVMIKNVQVGIQSASPYLLV